MARRPYSDCVSDQNGRALASATVTFTVYNGGAAATIYAAASGGSALAGGATTSGADGWFTIWIDDANHTEPTIFNRTVSKSGYETVTKPISL